MVEFVDGSTLAQASPPDMRLPDRPRASAGRDRVPGRGARPATGRSASTWEFFPLDDEAFPAVGLARRSGQAGGDLPGGVQRGQRGVRGGLPRRPHPRSSTSSTRWRGSSRTARTAAEPGIDSGTWPLSGAAGRRLGARAGPRRSSGWRERRTGRRASHDVPARRAGDRPRASAVASRCTSSATWCPPSVRREGDPVHGRLRARPSGPAAAARPSTASRPIPLGGYIRMIGMFPPKPGADPSRLRASSTGRFSQLMDQARQDSLEEVGPGDEHRVFYQLSVPKKVVIMLGGPTMNLLIAVVLLTGVTTLYGVERSSHRGSARSSPVRHGADRRHRGAPAVHRRGPRGPGRQGRAPARATGSCPSAAGRSAPGTRSGRSSAAAGTAADHGHRARRRPARP